MLDCNFCGVSVGFWNFIVVNCFVFLLNFGFEEILLFKKKFLELVIVGELVYGLELVILEVLDVYDIKFFEVV